MDDDVPVSKLKSGELRNLAASIGLSLAGKEKKNELVQLIEGSVVDMLNSLSDDEIRAIATDSGLSFPDGLQVAGVVPLIMENLSVGTVTRLALMARPADKDAIVSGLGKIGEELAVVEKDIEKVVHDMEQSAAPDMTDIYQIDQKLADVVKMNIDYSKTANMLDVGRIKFLDRRYMESMNVLMEAIKASEEMQARYRDITQAFIILSAERVLEDCRESESNDEHAADALINAKRSFFTTGNIRVDSIRTLTEVSQKVYKEEILFLERRLSEVEPMISALKVQGVDVFNAERYLHRAREAFLSGELVSVNTYIEKSVTNAEDSKSQWIQEIFNDMPRVESILKQASELGADISASEKHLAQAKQAFEAKDYSLCAELKKIAERKAMENQHLQIQKAAKLAREKFADAEKILVTISPLMAEAETYGIHVYEVMAIIQSARSAIVNNDYVNALTFARDAEARTKPIWTQVKAHREGIIASGEPLQHCRTCNSMGIKVFPNNKAVCVSCGMVYDIQVMATEQKKPGWFKKK